jgi:sec-independent protein translocase protein TatA
MPLGGAEILIVAFIIIFLFGAKKLPEFGRSLGLGMREFKQGITSSESEDEERERIDASLGARPVSTSSEVARPERDRVSQ